MTPKEPPARAPAGAVLSLPGTTPTSVPGLLLRPVRWPEEAAALVAIDNASRRAAGSLAVTTVAGLRAWYDHLQHSDLGADLRLGEVDDHPVACVRAEWRDERRGDRAFRTTTFRTPEAPAGTFAALLGWAMERHRLNAAGAPVDGRRAVVVTSTSGTDREAAAELRRRGFADVRIAFEMLRPSLEAIPDRALPAGVELRPVEPGHLRVIFEAEVDAFGGHWGAGTEEGSDAAWQEFLEDPFNGDTTLWQVAWAGDEIVGMVRPFVNEEENAVQGVRRGWCENISTRAAWRGKGVASSLICLALRALRDRGMTEAALGVDAQNETGALRLYESMGFREATREVEWRRPLGEVPGAAAPATDGSGDATLEARA